MNRILMAALVAAFASPALADREPVIVMKSHMLAANDAPEAARAQADAWKRWAEDFSNDMRASMGVMFAPRMGGKVVKGAPYTAEVVTESTQALADGNTITRKRSGLVFRDSEGRTRQETGGDGKSPSIHVSDPVEGKHYILAPGSKSAVALNRPAAREHKHEHRHSQRNVQVVRADGTEVRIEDGKVFIDGREFAPGRVEHTTARGKTVVVENGRITIDGKELPVRAPNAPSNLPGNRGEGEEGKHEIVKEVLVGDGTRREEVRVHVVRRGDAVGGPPLPPLPPMPPMPPGAPMAGVAPLAPLPGIHTFRFDTAKLGKGVTTSLGTREFDGVKAEGKSTAWTIPAGEIGNRNPIQITQETWYSPELQVIVHSRYHDPRTGETVYRLANIRRVEPAAELFKVPEDYKLKNRGRG